MKILYVCAGDLSRPFAPTIHVLETVSQLHRLGHAVEFVALSPGEPVIPSPVPFHRVIPPAGRWGRGWRGRRRLAVALEAAARRFRPDWIYERELAYTRAPLRIARAIGARHAIEINGIPGDEVRAGRRWSLKAGLLESVQRANLRETDLLVVVTEELRRTFRERAGAREDRAVVVPNGVDTDRFRPLDPADCRRRLARPAGARIVLFVGSFYPHHGVPEMVSALPFVRSRHPAVRFVFAGDGVSRRASEDLSRDLGIADVCEFPGAVPPAEVPLWIGAADLCLHGNITRSNASGDSGLKLYEYLACGKPVVALTSVRPTLDPSAARLLTTVPWPMPSPEALAGAISDRLDLGAPAPSEIEAVRQSVAAHHSWAASARTLAEHLERILAAPATEGR